MVHRSIPSNTIQAVHISWTKQGWVYIASLLQRGRTIYFDKTQIKISDDRDLDVSIASIKKWWRQRNMWWTVVGTFLWVYERIGCVWRVSEFVEVEPDWSIDKISFVWLWESSYVTATKKSSVHYIMQNPVIRQYSHGVQWPSQTNNLNIRHRPIISHYGYY